MKKRKNKWLKIYAILTSICAILILAAFCFVFHRAGYDTKLLVKLGLREPVAETNWAVVSWNNTMEKLNYDADVVFFGDSITRGSDFRAYFPESKIVNLGYSGDTLDGMLTRVSSVAAVTPEKVFIMGGINGITDKNIDQSIVTYSKLIEMLIATVPNSEIYIQSVLPISSTRESWFLSNKTIVEFNRKLAQLALEKDATYIDLYSLYEVNGEMNPELTTDGIHLHPDAYALWADAIAKYM